MSSPASYENPDVALTAGMILRECLRHEPLTKIILHNEIFYNFFDYVEMSTFDVASDAFSTFKDGLTKHKSLVAEFLEDNYDKFFNKYVALLNSSNYVTKRQSLKVLLPILIFPPLFGPILSLIFLTLFVFASSLFFSPRAAAWRAPSGQVQLQCDDLIHQQPGKS